MNNTKHKLFEEAHVKDTESKNENHHNLGNISSIWGLVRSILINYKIDNNEEQSCFSINTSAWEVGSK